MNVEATDVQVNCKYAKLVKWENDSQGLPNKMKPPLQVLEKFGEDIPFVSTFKRGDFHAFAQ